jgi:hypothetical protein
MLTSAYSPLTGIARRTSWASSRARERAVTFAAFALPPTVAFWAWFLVQGRHGIRHGYHHLVFAMPVTSLWITLGPMLMQHGEFGLEKLVGALNAPAVSGHLGVRAIQRAIDRADRCYYWLTLPFAFAAVAAVWLGHATISSIVQIRGPVAQAAGIVVISSVGFATASGMWGCGKALYLVRVATRTASPDWLPFRSQQPSGMDDLHEFCWSTALIFSSGSVSLPTLMVVQTRLPAPARAIVLLFVGILAIGGLVMFTVPILWLHRIGTVQKERLLDALATPIEFSHEVVLNAGSHSVNELRRREHVLNMALRLRTEISALSPLPLPQLVTRGAATLVLPLVLAILQLAVTSAL